MLVQKKAVCSLIMLDLKEFYVQPAKIVSCGGLSLLLVLDETQR